jgi:type I restriction enzyme, S subunit
MVAFPKYENYKDSGVKWLKKIPSHWKLQPGRVYLKPQKVKNIGNKVNTVLSLSYGKIVIKSEEKLYGLVPESFETYQIVEPGNIIVRATDLQNDQTSLRIGLVEDRGIITSAYLCLAPSEKMDSKYAYYLLHAYDLLKVYYGMGSGLRQNLDHTDFKYLQLPIPEIEEQKRIADFLDRKTAEIDQAIAQKQRLIELLQEQKAILINQAVTKGLNPNVVMRDSGVAWVGSTPEHWKLVQNRRFLNSLGQGSSPAIVNSVDEGFYVLKISAIKQGMYIDGETKSIPQKTFVPEYQVKKGDFLMTRGNTPDLVADIGYVDIDITENIMISDLIYRLSYNQEFILHEFMAYLFRSSVARNQIKICARGSSHTMVKVSQEHIKSWLILVPPLNEQEEIVSYLRYKENEILLLEKQIFTEIKKLSELKEVFVSQAVTGKIKIRASSIVS